MTNRIFNPDQIGYVLKLVRPFFRFSYYQNIKYFNVPMSFDIETSNFYENGEKRSVMWLWSLGIFGLTIQGRTWDDFIMCIEYLANELKLHEKKRIIIGVHNLAFEFSFMRKYFEWEKVFAIKPRTPVYALTTSGIEFRCTYIASGYSLEKVGEHLTTYKVEKLVGTLDYSKLRTPTTPRAPEDIAYMQNDVLVVMSYIMEEIERCGGIGYIPITKTGNVRKFVRDNCFYVPGEPKKKSIKRIKYRDIVKPLRLEVDEYRDLKAAFQGGFTHANAFFSSGVYDKIINEEVESRDIASSYPKEMIFNRYPMSKGELLTADDFKTDRELWGNTLDCYCSIIVCKFYGLESKINFEHYLSSSRCRDKVDVIEDNGRVVSASELLTTITDVDFEIINCCYKWDRMGVIRVWRYKRDYLPIDFVKSILELYRRKTELKGIEGAEVEYMQAKEYINSCYGMAVTDSIGKPDITYDSDLQKWDDISFYLPDNVISKNCEKYNNNPNRFLFFAWGCFVTAFARKSLWTAILHLKDDYIYSDTDSVKFRNPDQHTEFFDRYNMWVTDRLEQIIKARGLDVNALSPMNKKGEKKPIGIFENEGRYKRFKTLGAKRYMVEYPDGTQSLTVSGLNKTVTMPYLQSMGDPFELFRVGMVVPAEYTGKLVHTYIDHDISGRVTDYLGITGIYHEESFVHLSPADYSPSISQEYTDFLTSIEF